MSRECKSCLIIGILILCVFILTFYVGNKVGYTSGYNDAKNEDGQNLNEFFHNQYNSSIKEEGQSFIDDIVVKTEKYDNHSERLNQIAYLITHDFSDPFWADIADLNGNVHWKKYFYGNISGTKYKLLINNSKVKPQYWFEKRGKIRVDYIDNNLIFWEPEWIAYQKTGGCQELSVLFNATANKAGIETRIVRSDGADHFWNEVNVTGDWKYYDIQRYGQEKDTNDSTFWFGNRSEYGDKSGLNRCDITKYGVYIFDLQNGGYKNPPITESYDPNNLCEHGTRKI